MIFLIANVSLLEVILEILFNTRKLIQLYIFQPESEPKIQKNFKSCKAVINIFNNNSTSAIFCKPKVSVHHKLEDEHNLWYCSGRVWHHCNQLMTTVEEELSACQNITTIHSCIWYLDECML